MKVQTSIKLKVGTQLVKRRNKSGGKKRLYRIALKNGTQYNPKLKARQG